QDEQIIEKQEFAVSNTQTQEATKQTFAVVENEKTTDNIFQTEELTIDQPISVANESNAFTEQERSVSTMNHAFFSNQSEKSTKSNLKTLIISHKQKIKELKKSSSSDLDSILYIILCILIPFLAVGLATDWDLTKTVIALLLSIIFWIPGIIYAVIICSQEGVI
ncbi:MAG: YqaE/Pmp3 family membrane protein, partial [Crocinitomicaceae bacterium]|nr:YqaE/Pmp3 family membrane protein [Crocinitomicaceae bacterium]